MGFHIKPSWEEKKKKKQTKSKPILQTPVDGKAMAEPLSQRAGALTPLTPALLLLFGFNKNFSRKIMKAIIWTSLFLTKNYTQVIP